MKSFEELSRRGVKKFYDASSRWMRHMLACSTEFSRDIAALHVLHDLTMKILSLALNWSARFHRRKLGNGYVW